MNGYMRPENRKPGSPLTWAPKLKPRAVLYDVQPMTANPNYIVAIFVCPLDGNLYATRIGRRQIAATETN